MPPPRVLAAWAGAAQGIRDSFTHFLLTAFPNQMEKKKITEVFLKDCKSLSVHSHSRGLDGLWQAVSLLSGYPKQQSDHLPVAVWIHFREKFSSASAAPERKMPESDVMFRPSAAALQRRAGKGRRRAGSLCPHLRLVAADASQRRLGTGGTDESLMIFFLRAFGSSLPSPCRGNRGLIAPRVLGLQWDLTTSLPQGTAQTHSVQVENVLRKRWESFGGLFYIWGAVGFISSLFFWVLVFGGFFFFFFSLGQNHASSPSY